ncbi:MAG: hypothetical protein A2147_05810 [Chloroflexi bacterium RBG_16_57_8]|nr:MAG: hypothetical protein A2147_05810 [Chloroflexi bacterium RBG_16_57_8]
MGKGARFALVVLLLASILAGTLLGSGLALADLYFELSVGWNYLGGTQCNGAQWSWDEDMWEWMSSDRSRVDFDSAHYYNGQSNRWDTIFGDTWIYDKLGRDVYNCEWAFSGWHIQGINRTADLDPDFSMDELDATCDTVYVYQYVYYAAGAQSATAWAWTGQ